MVPLASIFVTRTKSAVVFGLVELKMDIIRRVVSFKSLYVCNLIV